MPLVAGVDSSTQSTNVLLCRADDGRVLGQGRAEYVGLGPARQAAWALAGTPDPPDWPRPSAGRFTGEPQPEVRSRYAALRDASAGWGDFR